MTTAAHSVSPGDLSFLSSLLTSGTADAAKSPSGTTTQPKNKKQGRATMMDPLLIAAAGTHSTRMHFTHAFKPLSYASCDDERLALASSTVRPRMESRQAPRSVRVQVEEEEKRRKQLADEMKEQQLAAQKAVEGKPAAVVVPTQEGGFELKEDGKLAREQEKAGGGRKLSHGQVHELKKDAFVDLLRQPSTPPPLEHPLSSPPFATSAPSAVKLESPSLAQSIAALPPATDYSAPPSTSAPSSSAHLPPLEVQCRVRTRIPTPHGHIFLHLYTNNHDTKEHLAFVADHAQMASTSLTTNAVEGTPIVAETRGQKLLPFIRSHSLDAKWHDGETDEERIVRGAYVGRLSADSHVASSANPHSLDPQASSHSHSSCSCPHPHAKLSTSSNSPTSNSSSASSEAPTDPPLVRIHSECLTGEIIGSQRCDCGEQLDEAFRLITLAGRGVVVYLRQEGRGIGLLEKMRAYNLQDLGHDTVTANLMLGHGADLRTYGVAGEILRDLGVADDGVRLLTNNPDKIRQIEKEGVRVRERVAMVPRSWMAVEEALARQARRRDRKKKRALERGRGPKNASATPSASVESSVASLIPSASSLASSSILPTRSPFISTSPRHSHSHSRSASPSSSSFVPSASASNSNSNSDSDSSDSDDDAASLAYHLRRAGVGMIGASTTASPELEKYLRTKIERMGHMLTAPANTPALVEENKRSPLSRRETAE